MPGAVARPRGGVRGARVRWGVRPVRAALVLAVGLEVRPRKGADQAGVRSVRRGGLSPVLRVAAVTDRSAGGDSREVATADRGVAAAGMIAIGLDRVGRTEASARRFGRSARPSVGTARIAARGRSVGVLAPAVRVAVPAAVAGVAGRAGSVRAPTRVPADRFPAA